MAVTIDTRFLAEVRTSVRSSSESNALVEQVNLILAAAEEVSKKGKKAKLPKDWSYNYQQHELTVQIDDYNIDPGDVKNVLGLVIMREFVPFDEVRVHAVDATRLILSLKVA